MKEITVSKWVMGCLMGIFALNTMAEVTISDVVARQRWPWSRLVDIDYVVTGEQSERVDVMLTAKDGSTTLTLPTDSLTGDMFGVAPGLKRIVWDPSKTTYTNSLMLTQFNATLTPITPPLYMIIDLTKSAGAAGQIEYVTEADLTNGVWGSWVRDPVTNRGTAVQSVIWTGVTNGTTYKTDKLVLRRVPAGSFYEGDDDGTQASNVTLTKDMYVGVFEVTQQQWNRIMTDGTGTDTQAKHTVCYWEIRENPLPANTGSDDPAVNWPSNTAVNATSFVGKLRAKTGISEFDLPTEAQWEYLCRAKTTTVFNDGAAGAYYTGVVDRNNGNTNDLLNALGWYKYSTIPSPTAAKPVGGKLPNAWGLYDTHGNVTEWCLDWNETNAELGSDPDGADSGSDRVLRGGSWLNTASSCRSAYRSSNSPSVRYRGNGFRLVRTLP
jgi:formylglycine-generating enzyme required for sulfatase activity